MYYQTCQLVTLPLNTSQTKMFSAPVEYKKMIYKELERQLEPFYKLLLIALLRMCLDNVVNLKKYNWEMRDIICLLNVNTQNPPPLSLEVAQLNILKKLRDH